MDKIKIFNFDLLSSSINSVKINNKILINTISPNSFTLSIKDPIFKEALIKTDILVLDGLYFNFAPLLLKGKWVKKNSGTDCFYHFMTEANKNKLKVFLLGSSVRTLELMKDRAKNDYPNIVVSSYSPPFKDDFDKTDNDLMIEKINSFKPDVLFIGMTAPKQEKWAYLNKNTIDSKVICTIGNVFDWYAGTQKQPGKIWVKLGLEWLIRTIHRPEILKRYPNVFYFFWILFLNILRIRRD